MGGGGDHQSLMTCHRNSHRNAEIEQNLMMCHQNLHHNVENAQKLLTCHKNSHRNVEKKHKFWWKSLKFSSLCRKCANFDDVSLKCSLCYLKVGHKVIIVPQDDKPNCQKLQQSWVRSQQSLTQRNWGAADEAVFNKVHNLSKNPQFFTISTYNS
jgi:hypothetical protein